MFGFAHLLLHVSAMNVFITKAIFRQYVITSDSLQRRTVAETETGCLISNGMRCLHGLLELNGRSDIFVASYAAPLFRYIIHARSK